MQHFKYKISKIIVPMLLIIILSLVLVGCDNSRVNENLWSNNDAGDTEVIPKKALSQSQIEQKLKPSVLKVYVYDYDKTTLHNIVSFEDNTNPIDVEIAFQFCSGYQENVISFVNLVRTGDGGTHETGFRSGFTKVFNEYARKYGLLKIQ